MSHIFLKMLLFGTLTISACTPIFASSPQSACCRGTCKSATQQKCSQTPYYKEFLVIFDTMKTDMSSAKPTGNVTQDFLSEMIPHHQAAISMAQNILKYTKNPEITTLANNIVKEQTAGIEQMKALQKSLQEAPPAADPTEAEYLKNYSAIYTNMVDQMALAKPTCNDDVDFLSEMIPHHEGAIAMAKNVLKYTQNDEMKAIAKNIVKTQKPQAKKLQQLLKSLDK